MSYNERGFSLIEVLIAIVMSAIALSGIGLMGVNTFKADTQSAYESAAIALAQAKFEQLHNLQRTETAWADGEHSESDLDANGESGGSYERAWEIEEDYNGFDGLTRVSVTVAWPAGEVTLSSLYW